MSAGSNPLRNHPRYDFVKRLGGGISGQVVQARDKQHQRDVAIKILPRGNTITKYVASEMLNHRRMHHPHVIKFYEAFLTATHLCIVLEFAEQGDLYSYVQRRLRLPEDQARWLFQQHILALDYIHKRNVCTRDVKLENTLVAGEPCEKPLIKICDFGMSRDTVEEAAPASTAGTLAYMAPEVLDHGQSYDGCMVDIWSSGVFLFSMLEGRYPFDRPADKHLLPNQATCKVQQRIKACDLQYTPHTPPGAKDLIQRMLVVNPAQRITMQQIQQHPWFNQDLPKGVMDMNEKLLQYSIPQQQLEAHATQVLALVKEAGRRLSYGTPVSYQPVITPQPQFQERPVTAQLYQQQSTKFTLQSHQSIQELAQRCSSLAVVAEAMQQQPDLGQSCSTTALAQEQTHWVEAQTLHVPHMAGQQQGPGQPCGPHTPLQQLGQPTQSMGPLEQGARSFRQLLVEQQLRDQPCDHPQADPGQPCDPPTLSPEQPAQQHQRSDQPYSQFIAAAQPVYQMQGIPDPLQSRRSIQEMALLCFEPQCLELQCPHPGHWLKQPPIKGPAPTPSTSLSQGLTSHADAVHHSTAGGPPDSAQPHLMEANDKDLSQKQLLAAAFKVQHGPRASPHAEQQQASMDGTSLASGQLDNEPHTNSTTTGHPHADNALGQQDGRRLQEQVAQAWMPPHSLMLSVPAQPLDVQASIMNDIPNQHLSMPLQGTAGLAMAGEESVAPQQDVKGSPVQGTQGAPVQGTQTASLRDVQNASLPCTQAAPLQGAAVSPARCRQEADGFEKLPYPQMPGFPTEQRGVVVAAGPVTADRQLVQDVEAEQQHGKAEAAPPMAVDTQQQQSIAGQRQEMASPAAQHHQYGDNTPVQCVGPTPPQQPHAALGATQQPHSVPLGAASAATGHPRPGVGPPGQHGAAKTVSAQHGLPAAADLSSRACESSSSSATSFASVRPGTVSSRGQHGATVFPSHQNPYASAVPQRSCQSASHRRASSSGFTQSYKATNLKRSSLDISYGFRHSVKTSLQHMKDALKDLKR